MTSRKKKKLFNITGVDISKCLNGKKQVKLNYFRRILLYKGQKFLLNIYIHTHTHTHTHIYIYMCIYTHTHIYIEEFRSHTQN